MLRFYLYSASIQSHFYKKNDAADDFSSTDLFIRLQFVLFGPAKCTSKKFHNFKKKTHPSASGCTSIDRIFPTRMSSLVISGASTAAVGDTGAGAAASAVAGASTSADLATVEGAEEAAGASDMMVRRARRGDDGEREEGRRGTAKAAAGLAVAATTTVASRARALLRAALAI